MQKGISLRPAVDGDIDFPYDLRAATMKDYGDKTWGWDEYFQSAGFRKNYVPDEVRIVCLDGGDIGLLSVEDGKGISS